MENTLPFYQKTWFIILMLLVCLPVGLFLMWLYSPWSFKVKSVISLLFTAIFAVIIIASAKSPNATPPLTQNQAISAKEDPLVLEKTLKSSIKASDSILCEFQDIKVTTIDENTRYLVVNLKTKPGYDKESILSDFNETAKYIFKDVYSSNQNIKFQNCKIVYNATLVDAKTGEEFSDAIYSISLDNDSANNMHWDKIKNIDISQSVKDRYVHPSLNNMN